MFYAIISVSSFCTVHQKIGFRCFCHSTTDTQNPISAQQQQRYDDEAVEHSHSAIFISFHASKTKRELCNQVSVNNKPTNLTLKLLWSHNRRHTNA